MRSSVWFFCPLAVDVCAYIVQQQMAKSFDYLRGTGVLNGIHLRRSVPPARVEAVVQPMVLREVGLGNPILSFNCPALADCFYQCLMSSFCFKTAPNLNEMPGLLQISFETVLWEDGHLVSQTFPQEVELLSSCTELRRTLTRREALLS